MSCRVPRAMASHVAPPEPRSALPYCCTAFSGRTAARWKAGRAQRWQRVRWITGCADRRSERDSAASGTASTGAAGLPLTRWTSVRGWQPMRLQLTAHIQLPSTPRALSAAHTPESYDCTGLQPMNTKRTVYTPRKKLRRPEQSPQPQQKLWESAGVYQMPRHAQDGPLCRCTGSRC